MALLSLKNNNNNNKAISLLTWIYKRLSISLLTWMLQKVVHLFIDLDLQKVVLERDSQPFWFWAQGCESSGARLSLSERRPGVDQRSVPERHLCSVPTGTPRGQEATARVVRGEDPRGGFLDLVATF